MFLQFYLSDVAKMKLKDFVGSYELLFFSGELLCKLDIPVPGPPSIISSQCQWGPASIWWPVSREQVINNVKMFPILIFKIICDDVKHAGKRRAWNTTEGQWGKTLGTIRSQTMQLLDYNRMQLLEAKEMTVRRPRCLGKHTMSFLILI